MRSHPWKDRLLDGLLAVLVTSSVVLSLQTWYPADEFLSSVTTSPSVQPQPPVSDQQMPDVFRPEMLLYRRAGNAIASIYTGSLSYRQIWPELRGVLTGLQVNQGAITVDQVPDRRLQAEWIQVRLPVALMLSQWAELWRWNASSMRNGTIRIDRLTIYLDEPGTIYLSGPTVGTLYLADLPAERRARLLELFHKVDPTLFAEHRQLELKDIGVRARPETWVPVTRQMPLAQMRVITPEARDEEARYFPDISVIRQIDEEDARSLTDGQRLLRLSASGVLEYRTADISSNGNAPTMDRSLALAQEWVGSRGGWPQEIVLRRYMQQPGRATLEFDYRFGGPFPVESLGAAFRLELTAQRVVYFSKYPTFVELRFAHQQQEIITPELAAQRAVDQVPILLVEPIRSMHLAYVAKAGPDGPPVWALDPVWVVQAGENRVYVYAAIGKEKVLPQRVR